MTLHKGDIEWAMSDPPGGLERIFSIDLSPENAGSALDELIFMIKNNKAPSGILVTPSSKPDNIAEILSSKGFNVDYDTGSGMAMDLSPSISEIIYAKNIQIIPVEDTDTLETWGSIVSTALFECELFSKKQFHDLLMLDNTYFYLGLLDNQPAATCMAIADGDIATIEMVSTLKEYRKKGLGTAVVTTTLKKLYETGIKTATLRSEKEAIDVYKCIGFTEYYKRIVASYNLR